MPASAFRQDAINNLLDVYYCNTRCVRRAFLCGPVAATGKEHHHREHWAPERLQKLALIFTINIYCYAIVNAHLHVVLRGGPDLWRNWTDFGRSLSRSFNKSARRETGRSNGDFERSEPDRLLSSRILAGSSATWVALLVEVGHAALAARSDNASL